MCIFAEIKVVALVTLSSIIEEELSPSLLNDESLFEIIVGSLNNAWRAATKQYKGYTTVDMTQAVARLAGTNI